MGEGVMEAYIFVIVALFLVLLASWGFIYALMFELRATERMAAEHRAKALEVIDRLVRVHQPPTRDWVMKQPGVYVIRAHEWVKIGYASNVARRLDDYVVSIPRGYELIAIFYCEKPAELERQLHYRYQRMRRRGEWFYLPEEVIEGLKVEAEGYKGR